MQYTRDYDEKVPSNYVQISAGVFRFWPDLLQPYVKNYQIFVCPSDSTPITYPYNRASGDANPLLLSYAPNGVITCSAGDMASLSFPAVSNSTAPVLYAGLGQTIVAVEEPSTTILITEKRVRWLLPFHLWPTSLIVTRPISAARPQLWLRPVTWTEPTSYFATVM